jgi:hypothetical protein
MFLEAVQYPLAIAPEGGQIFPEVNAIPGKTTDLCTISKELTILSGNLPDGFDYYPELMTSLNICRELLQ